ncbi:MAG: hypothetical protein V1754_05240, partial [Pseudomonadota bacterium]
FSTKLFSGYSRSVAARNQEGPQTIARDVNENSLGVSVQPGGGRLTLSAGYSLGLDAYEDPDFAYNNRLTHTIGLNGSWKAFPKTALTLSINQGFIDYYSTSSPGAYLNNTSRPFRAEAGLSGLVTPLFALVAKLGYGNSFHNDGPQYNSILATVQGTLALRPFAKVVLSFDHGFQDSIYGNYYTDEHVSLRYDHVIFNRVVTFLDASYRYRRYAGLPAVYGTETVSEWVNHLLSLNIAVDYRIYNWLFVGIGYDFQLRLVPNPLTIENLTGTNEYVKHDIYAKVGISY